MGNCAPKGVSGECPNMIRVVTNSGGLMEIKGPKLVKDVLGDHVGHGIFRQVNDAASCQMFDYEYLVGGQIYYLSPLEKAQSLGESEVRSQIPNMGLDEIVKPKMSQVAGLDSADDRAQLQVLPSLGNGVWRVKLVINTKELGEILSEKENTEALIEKMRVAAAGSASFKPRRSKGSWGVARSSGLDISSKVIAYC